MATGSILALRLMGLLNHIWYGCPFRENYFTPIIFAFNDFGIFIYLGPRPIGKFGVQHAKEFKYLSQLSDCTPTVKSIY